MTRMFRFNESQLDTKLMDEVTNRKRELGDDEYDVTDQVDDTQGLPAGINPDPVSVLIANDKAIMTIDRAAQAWQSQKVLVLGAGVVSIGYNNTQAQLVVGANPRRRWVFLENIGAKNIAIGPSIDVRFGGTISNGLGVFGNWEIQPSSSNLGSRIMKIPTTAEIYAIADPASTTGEALNIMEIFDAGQF